MKLSEGTSRNIIDKRSVATHGISWIIGLFAGLLGTWSTPADPDKDIVQVVSTALDRAQEYWSTKIPGWRDAKVIIFTSQIDTPCGTGNSMTGPFYCPANERIYIDLDFFRHLNGDLAQAVVIAHEVGHHVQLLSGRVENTFQVELQADCYAGVWISHEQRAGRLEHGDLEEAYNQAASVGDTGAIDTWTHGDADHRVAALRKGITTGICTL